MTPAREPSEPRALVRAAALALDYAAMAAPGARRRHLDIAGTFLAAALALVDAERMSPVATPFPPEALEA